MAYGPELPRVGLDEVQAVFGLAPPLQGRSIGLRAPAIEAPPVDLDGVVGTRRFDIEPLRVGIPEPLVPEFGALLRPAEIAVATRVDEDIGAPVVPDDGEVIGLLVDARVKRGRLGKYAALSKSSPPAQSDLTTASPASGKTARR